MEGYKIQFCIYGDSEEEAENARKAIVAFISELAYNGRAVTGNKILLALKKLKENKFMKNKVYEFFERK